MLHLNGGDDEEVKCLIFDLELPHWTCYLEHIANHFVVQMNQPTPNPLMQMKSTLSCRH